MEEPLVVNRRWVFGIMYSRYNSKARARSDDQEDTSSKHRRRDSSSSEDSRSASTSPVRPTKKAKVEPKGTKKKGTKAKATHGDDEDEEMLNSDDDDNDNSSGRKGTAYQPNKKATSSSSSGDKKAAAASSSFSSSGKKASAVAHRGRSRGESIVQSVNSRHFVNQSTAASERINAAAERVSHLTDAPYRFHDEEDPVIANSIFVEQLQAVCTCQRRRAAYICVMSLTYVMSSLLCGMLARLCGVRVPCVPFTRRSHNRRRPSRSIEVIVRRCWLFTSRRRHRASA